MKSNTRGFTLVELMVAVAIISILAAVSIPIYTSYIRRSYVSEAMSSISAIKSAEESYFSINGCYISASWHPTATPTNGRAFSWDTPAATDLAWGRTGLGVRPDRTVRFQYQVYASNSLTAGASCAAPTLSLSNRTQGVGHSCISAANVRDTFVNAVVFPTNWYIVHARTDFDGGGCDGSGDFCTELVSAIDDSAVITCHELD